MKPDIHLSAIRNRDAGMVVALVLFVLYHFCDATWAFGAGIGALVVSMTTPFLFTPFTKVWFGFADLLSSFMSAIILGLLYTVAVCPISLLMKMFGYDPLMTGKWKKDKESLFKNMHNDISIDYFDKPY